MVPVESVRRMATENSKLLQAQGKLSELGVNVRVEQLGPYLIFIGPQAGDSTITNDVLLCQAVRVGEAPFLFQQRMLDNREELFQIVGRPGSFLLAKGGTVALFDTGLGSSRGSGVLPEDTPQVFLDLHLFSHTVAGPGTRWASKVLDTAVGNVAVRVWEFAEDKIAMVNYLHARVQEGALNFGGVNRVNVLESCNG